MSKPRAKVLVGTVKGDMHDIGKNLVAMMLESAGFDVQDLGSDVHPNKFVDAVNASHPICRAFGLLTKATMPSMKSTIDALAQGCVTVSR
ncbi:MAG: cobalamin-dependent protein [Caldilineaceae bacterium]